MLAKMLSYISNHLHTLFFINIKSTMNNKRQDILKNANRSHRESMRKSLNVRLEAARANGNEKLIKQLEAEAKYLHL